MREASEVVSLPEQVSRMAALEPEKVAICEVSGHSLTRREFWLLGNAWAEYLSTEHGVSANDPVLVMQPTSIRALGIWLGLSLLRAIEVPVNTELKGALLEHVLNDSRAHMAIVDPRYVPQIAQTSGRGNVADLLVTGELESPPAGFSITVLPDEPPPAENVIERFPRESDLACLLYTSGTTGASKGVMVSWGQLWATTIGTGPERTLRSPSTVFYSPYPAFHISGKTPLYATMLGGGSLVVRERFSTRAFWDDIHSYGCTFTLLIATTANFILSLPSSADDADNPLVAVLFSPWIPGVEDFKVRFGVEAYSVYNMTEISCPIVGGWQGGPVDPAICGRLREGFEARLVDEQDHEVPHGTRGELILRTDRPWRMMSGYWHKEEATVEAWRNQWFHTGDVFVRTQEGEFRYIDRKKDSIRRRGENISATEVESETLTHTAVQTAAAVAVPDDISEQEIKLVVSLTHDTELDALSLHEYLRERLPEYMVPRYIEFVNFFPRTATQKIRKNELRSIGITAATWDRRGEGNQR